MKQESATSRRCRLCHVTVIAISAVLLCRHASTSDDQPELNIDASAKITDTTLSKLLELNVERETLPAFVQLLESLAETHGWKGQLEESKEITKHDWDEVRAVPLRSGKDSYVVVLLKSWDQWKLGGDVQTVLLLDGGGNLKDRLACVVHARLTRMHRGRYHTVLPDKPQLDGARMIIRLDRMRVRGNFSHAILHGGKADDFYWGFERLPEDEPTQWDKKGLCRIAIKGGKLKVLFPTENDRVPDKFP